MATQTLINYLGPTDGSGSGVETTTMSRQRIETYPAGATVVVGDLVSFDLSALAADSADYSIVKADTGAALDILAVGFVHSSAELNGALTAGSRVNVVVAGYCATANVDAATVAGTRLQVGGTAGRAAIAATIDEAGAATVPQYPIVAIALAADTANYAPVWVVAQIP